MNKTNFNHAFWAVVLQLFVFFVTGSMLAGFCAGIAFFVGREHAQFEYKIGGPGSLKPWEGFQVWKWSTDAILDVVFPVIAVSLVMLVYYNI